MTVWTVKKKTACKHPQQEYPKPWEKRDIILGKRFLGGEPQPVYPLGIEDLILQEKAGPDENKPEYEVKSEKTGQGKADYPGCHYEVEHPEIDPGPGEKRECGQADQKGAKDKPFLFFKMGGKTGFFSRRQIKAYSGNKDEQAYNKRPQSGPEWIFFYVYLNQVEIFQVVAEVKPNHEEDGQPPGHVQDLAAVSGDIH
jgi:hypothetical protein